MTHPEHGLKPDPDDLKALVKALDDEMLRGYPRPAETYLRCHPNVTRFLIARNPDPMSKQLSRARKMVDAGWANGSYIEVREDDALDLGEWLLYSGGEIIDRWLVRPEDPDAEWADEWPYQ